MPKEKQPVKRILIVTDNLLDQVNGVVTTFTNVEKQALKNNYKISYIDPSLFFHFSALGYPEVKISIPFNVGKIVERINPDYIHIATEGTVGLARDILIYEGKIDNLSELKDIYKFNAKISKLEKGKLLHRFMYFENEGKYYTKK